MVLDVDAEVIVDVKAVQKQKVKGREETRKRAD